MQAENKNYIVAIDLGSGSVTAAAGSKDPDGRLNIIDMVSKPMQGMSCGEVINIEQVTGAVRAAVGELEEHLGIKVTEAYAGISGHDIKCADSSYFVYVSGEDHEICEEDVAKLHESMNSLQPPEGICILDRTPQKYVIDSREETMQPVGRFGQQLEATFNFILANRGSLERLNKAFLRLGIVQRRLFTNAQASAAAILTEDEKELGAAVIDIGAGCTDICIWQDNIMRYVGVLPVGSDAINRDIRSIAIPERFIEKLKTTHGYAVAAQIPEEKRSQNIKIKGRTQRENKEISVLQARSDNRGTSAGHRGERHGGDKGVGICRQTRFGHRPHRRRSLPQGYRHPLPGTYEIRRPHRQRLSRTGERPVAPGADDMHLSSAIGLAARPAESRIAADAEPLRKREKTEEQTDTATDRQIPTDEGQRPAPDGEGLDIRKQTENDTAKRPSDGGDTPRTPNQRQRQGQKETFRRYRPILQGNLRGRR